MALAIRQRLGEEGTFAPLLYIRAPFYTCFTAPLFLAPKVFLSLMIPAPDSCSGGK
jgi:hypothetical protein